MNTSKASIGNRHHIAVIGDHYFHVTQYNVNKLRNSPEYLAAKPGRDFSWKNDTLPDEPWRAGGSPFSARKSLRAIRDDLEELTTPELSDAARAAIRQLVEEEEQGIFSSETSMTATTPPAEESTEVSAEDNGLTPEIWLAWFAENTVPWLPLTELQVDALPTDDTFNSAIISMMEAQLVECGYIEAEQPPEVQMAAHDAIDKEIAYWRNHIGFDAAEEADDKAEAMVLPSWGSMPGALGIICRYMATSGPTSLAPAVMAAALQTLSTLAYGAKPAKVKTLSLITLTVALSGAGKDYPMKTMQRILKALGVPVAAEPRSDKAIWETGIANDGLMNYVVDECQNLFSQMHNDAGSAYVKAIEPLIMQLATSDEAMVPSNILNQSIARFGEQMSKIEKMMDKIGDRKGIWAVKTHEEVEAELDRLQAQFAHLERRAERLENYGLENIQFNFLGSTTPEAFRFINRATVERGFIGRCILFHGGDVRFPALRDVPEFNQAQWDELIKVCRQVREFGQGGAAVTMDEEAVGISNAIWDKYQGDPEMLNHPVMGAVHSRVRERVLTLANIIATGNGGRINAAVMNLALFIVEDNLKHLNRILARPQVDDRIAAEMAFRKFVLSKAAMKYNQPRTFAFYHGRLKHAPKLMKVNDQYQTRDKNGAVKSLLERTITKLTGEGLLKAQIVKGQKDQWQITIRGIRELKKLTD